MQTQTQTKWDKIREFINLWLKDPKVYCGSCGANFSKETFPCCDNPIVGTNLSFTKEVIDLCRDLQRAQKNVYASTDKKDLRHTVKLPTRLLHDLDIFHRQNWGYKLFGKKGDLRAFMRKFPMFRVPERV